MHQALRVVIIKPSKYMATGFVERFRRGFMPNSTVPYMCSMVPAEIDGSPVETHAIDEYGHTDLKYLQLLFPSQGKHTLVALVGVQSHQFHRALDLAAYPARGCPFLCNFCSVAKIAGRRIRSQSIDTTLASLRAAKAAGVRTIMFTSDNFNKYPAAEELLTAMADERLGLKFFVQCDTQIARQKHLVDLLGKAGCFQMLVGVESFNRQTLLAAQKGQNRPETYQDIVRLCHDHGISSHFSNIIGFPQDMEQDVHEHLEVLRDLDPTWSSFYILCPIPGTEQYDDFLAEGSNQPGRT